MATQYRIYTENKNKEQVISLLNNYLGDFTVFEATGYWNRQGEDSLIIEIIGSKNITSVIHEIATKIKIMNQQQAVLVTKVQVDDILI